MKSKLSLENEIFVSLKINTFHTMGILTSIVNDDSISNLCPCWFSFLIKKRSFSYSR